MIANRTTRLLTSQANIRAYMGRHFIDRHDPWAIALTVMTSISWHRKKTIFVSSQTNTYGRQDLGTAYSLKHLPLAMSLGRLAGIPPLPVYFEQVFFADNGVQGILVE